MRGSIDRRDFLKTSAAAAAVCGLGGARRLLGAEVKTPAAEKLGWKLCGQLYTFRSFALYEALPMIESLGLTAIEPCFFLRLDKARPKLRPNETLSADDRKELKKRLADHGVAMTNYYSNVGDNPQTTRKIFDFAKEMGVETFVAEPRAEAFDGLEKLCDEYKINLAVHNHPKSPRSKYWQPENVLKVCEGRGKRIGACCDTGHWIRSDLKPVECLKKMEGRIITMHVKDVPTWGKPKERDVPLGTGVADYAAVLGELKRQKFQGILSIEYEHQSPKLVDDVAECMTFVETTAKKLAG